MTFTYVPLAVKAAITNLEEALPILTNGKPSLALALHVSEMLRRMAVGVLLISGTPTDFFAHLSMSGRSFLHFLNVADDESKATSKFVPFFDAIACNDLDGARRIAQNSRATWNERLEYEDDFIYVRWLMKKYFLHASDAELRSDLVRYENILEGASDTRLDVCRALLDTDQDLFDSSTEAHVSADRARFDRERREGRLDPDEAATTMHVSTELLAWLRLADESGLVTARRIPMAPRIARRFDLVQLPDPDAWRKI